LLVSLTVIASLHRIFRDSGSRISSSSANTKYSFDALAQTMLAFTDALGLKSSALYVFDYGAPTGFRLDMARPERVTAIVSQNGNAYVEGLGDARAPSRRCWMHPTSENREAIRKGLNAEGVRGEYSVGIPNRSCEANVIDMFIRKIRQITETALRVSGDQNLGMRVDVALGSGGAVVDPISQ
jgi:pimeloyl-ACP methyl ester carboxylesterase